MKKRFELLLLLFVCSLIKINSQVNLGAGLNACYPLNGNATESLNALTGTLSAISATVDRFNNTGSAVHFAGTSSSLIRLPNSSLIKPANAVSFSLWIKPEQTSGANLIYTRNNLNSNFEAYQLGIYAGSPVFRLNKSSSFGNDIVLSTTTVSPMSWYHVVGTIDNNFLKLYVNGVLEGTTPSTFSGFDYMTGREVILGNSNEFLTFPFLGTMDNLRIYDRVLNPAEISALYNSDPVCQGAVSPPVSSFSVSSVVICGGQSISFKDLSLNTPTSWSWTVNGSISQSSFFMNPTFTFNIPGIYTMSLTTSNAGGLSINTATQSLVVLPNPVVSIAASNTNICPGQKTTLTANGATTYTWSNSVQGSSIVVSPNTSIQYNVVGSDANGCIGSDAVFLLWSPDCGTFIGEWLPSSISAYPNPFSDKLHFIGDAILVVKVFDNLGIEVGSIEKIPAEDLQFETIDLAPGIYTARINTSLGNFRVKLIKN